MMPTPIKGIFLDIFVLCFGVPGFALIIKMSQMLCFFIPKISHLFLNCTLPCKFPKVTLALKLSSISTFTTTTINTITTTTTIITATTPPCLSSQISLSTFGPISIFWEVVLQASH